MARQANGLGTEMNGYAGVATALIEVHMIFADIPKEIRLFIIRHPGSLLSDWPKCLMAAQFQKSKKYAQTQAL